MPSRISVEVRDDVIVRGIHHTGAGHTTEVGSTRLSPGEGTDLTVTFDSLLALSQECKP